MAVFVHFTDENNKNSIIHNGLKVSIIHYEQIKKGIFCMPVLSDFYATHQWVREIKQYNSGNEIIAIYFKIPDDEIVFCGKYNDKLIKTKAAESHKIFLSLEDKMGFQVIIQRKILKTEITKIKTIPQIIGWRHFPKSHERKRCLCPACLTKGSYNSNSTKRLELGKLYKILRNTQNIDIIKGILYKIMDLKIRDKTGTKEEEILKSYLQSNDADLIITTIGCISELYQGNYRNFFFETIYNGGNIEIIESCIYALMRIYGDSIINEISTEKCDKETNKFIEYMKEE